MKKIKDFSVKGLRNKFKTLSIGGKLWGSFLFLSVCSVSLFILFFIGKVVVDTISRYSEEEIIPFIIWGFLIVAGVSYFFMDKKYIKWIFNISWILSIVLIAGLIIYDYRNNIRKDVERSRSNYSGCDRSDNPERCQNKLQEAKARMKQHFVENEY